MTETQCSGPLGALMDEYERAAAELINLLRTVDGARFLAEYPQEAEHLRSIQQIIRHVSYCGTLDCHARNRMFMGSSKTVMDKTRQLGLNKSGAAIVDTRPFAGALCVTGGNNRPGKQIHLLPRPNYLAM